MSLFSKSNVPVADLPKKSRTFRGHTLATQSFFQLTPVFVKDLYINDDLQVSGDMFSRLLPLQFPAFATCDNYVRAFFVPYRTIQPSFIDMGEDQLHIPHSGNPVHVVNNRYCYNTDFVKAFVASTHRAQLTSQGIGEADIDPDADFVTCNTANITRNYKFLAEGAQVYKVLCGLGYELNGNLTNDLGADDQINMLPLMAYLRVFYDWYWPKNYPVTADVSQGLSILKRDTGDERLTQADIQVLMNLVGYTFYNNEVFDEAWDYPNVPNYDGASSISILPPDISAGVSDGIVHAGDGHTPVYDLTTEGITKVGLNLLNALSDFFKRNQLSGAASVVDRFLARHGIKLDAKTVNRSIYLGEQRFQIGISDVAATMQDVDTKLGDLAGKGISKGQCVFECHAGEDRGLFLILLSTIPDASLVQGIDKMCLKSYLTQHYLPEFAHRGPDAVSSAEVYLFKNPYKNRTSDNLLISDHPFGFLPAWYEYNFYRSKLIGDYRLKSRGGGSNGILQSEHTFRLFDDSSFSGADDVVHSLDFQKSNDRKQYHRLDYLGEDSQDFSRCFFEWLIHYNSSIPLVKDAYNFSSDVEHGNRDVSVDTTGSKFN